MLLLWFNVILEVLVNIIREGNKVRDIYFLKEKVKLLLFIVDDCLFRRLRKIIGRLVKLVRN